MTFELDETDRDLCALLRTDGRRTNTDLARDLDVSESLVRKKLKRLISAGFLRVVAAANPQKLGYEIDIWGGLIVQPGMVNAVVDGLNALEPVRYVAVVSGSYDIFFEALFREQRELLEFLTDELPKVKGIVRVETWHLLKVAKRNFDWLFTFDQPEI